MRPVNFRLTADTLDFYVDVRLRNFGGRWLAVADIAGEQEVGLGRSARAALGACLLSLGRAAAESLLTDAAELKSISADHVRPLTEKSCRCAQQADPSRLLGPD